MYPWKEISIIWDTKNSVPADPGWAVYSDDRPRDRRGPDRLGISAGRRAGRHLRFPPASAAKISPYSGSDLCFRRTVDSVGSGLRNLQGGFPFSLRSRIFVRCRVMGSYRGTSPAAGIFRFLGHIEPLYASFPDSAEKNIDFNKKNVCICGKMGYNRMDLSSAYDASIRRKAIWTN